MSSFSDIRAIINQAHETRDAKAVMGEGEERLDRPGHFVGEERRETRRDLVNGRSVSRGTQCFLDSIRASTPVQHNPTGKNDQNDVNRPRPITY